MALLWFVKYNSPGKKYFKETIRVKRIKANFVFENNQFVSGTHVQKTNQTWWVKFMKMSTSSSFTFVGMSLDHLKRSIRLSRQIERLKIVSETNIDLHIRRTKLINSKFTDDNAFLASFGRKFITDMVELIGSTRLKFDVRPNRRS